MDIFAVNLLLATLATQATLVSGRRRDVVIAPPDAAEVRARRVCLTVMVTAVALSIGLAWVNTTAAKYCWLLIPSPVGCEPLSHPHHLTPTPGRHTWPVASPSAGGGD